MMIKNHFHKKGFALGLALKQRLTLAEKSVIRYSTNDLQPFGVVFPHFHDPPPPPQKKKTTKTKTTTKNQQQQLKSNHANTGIAFYVVSERGLVSNSRPKLSAGRTKLF